MRIYIVRHAIAEMRSISARDEDRALTPEGIDRMRRAAAGIKSLDFVPEVVWSSPLVRARQTADILLETFGAGVPLLIRQDLAPGGDRKSLYREIGKNIETVRGLMLVGHQPSLGEIAGDLAWGSPDHYIELKKGGLCVIELENIQGSPKGRLVALLTPAILRRISLF